ncbi:MAG: hypothetical protein M3Y22_13770, partial [Pseudomonadota bacterium]|nr:hypothetical protein [Pseudomonadota bacterium]
MGVIAQLAAGKNLNVHGAVGRVLDLFRGFHGVDGGRMIGGKVYPEADDLGCVTELSEAQVDHGGGQISEAHPTAARFVAAECDPG